MKKFIITIIAALAAISMSAQSIEIHQSYTTDSENAAYGASRAIVSGFWSGDKWNVFSWNSLDRASMSTLLYGEYEVLDNLYIHPEVRTSIPLGAEYLSSDVNLYGITGQLGVAYLLPLNCGLSVYLTPKASYGFNRIKLGDAENYTNLDFQFSINTSYENDWLYYEGYIDTNWLNNATVCSNKYDYTKELNNFYIFTEQKAFYKITPTWQIGACLVFHGQHYYNSDFKDGNFAFCQPYLALRIAL